MTLSLTSRHGRRSRPLPRTRIMPTLLPPPLLLLSSSTSPPIRITSLKGFDKQLSENPKLNSTPPNTKKLQRALKKLPQEVELADDEILCLVDTGSTVHAADAEG